ncbi:MAG: type III-B CRISPR-associated protein Cas10/Cmr2 [Saprospiraceae bacterium]
MSTNTYLAITIGPIYKTLQKAQKTREIWMASYLFSIVMKNLWHQAKELGTIYLPTDPGEEKRKGVGIFPDRLIMTIIDTTIDIQAKVIEPAIKNCAESLGLDEATLKKYLQIHHLIISEDTLMSFEYKDIDGKNVESFVHRINFLLNNMELNSSYSNSNEAFFSELFGSRTRSKFVKNAFGERRHNFPSILEISAKDKLEDSVLELLYKDECSDDESSQINKAINNLSKVHKYIAILSGDGDNFGNVMGALGSEKAEILKFSDKLVTYSQSIIDIIHNYGGTVIYIGGDDLLCFAPVENKGDNIFNLIENLNVKFKETFSEEIYKIHKVSMSYGLSISYYKYPLNEALQLSYSLLNGKAKKNPLKNCLAYQVLLHGGTYRDVLIPFDEAYKDFILMLKNFKEKDQLLLSLTHKFVEDDVILSLCLQDSKRLAGYFENHFDISERRSESVRNFAEQVKASTSKTYLQMQKQKESIKDEISKARFDVERETLNQLNTICRTLNFLIPNE